MSFFVECDIEGCTERGPIDIDSEVSVLPIGWSTIATARAPTAEDAVAIANETVPDANDGGLISALKAGIAAGFMSAREIVVDTRYACPNHPLPRWRKTATGATTTPTAQPELPGILDD